MLACACHKISECDLRLKMISKDVHGSRTKRTKHLESEKVEVNADKYAEFMRYKKISEYGIMEIDEGGPRKKNGPRAWINLCDSKVNFLIDTGASLNVIYEVSFSKLVIRPKIKRCNTETSVISPTSRSQLLTSLLASWNLKEGS